MGHVVLGILSLMLACMTHASAAAHGRPGAGVDAVPSHVRVAMFGAPAACGLCRDDGDCSLKAAAGARPRVPRKIGRYQAPAQVLDAIDTASAMTDVEFDYLLRAAALESSFNPALEASTSSAAGLYQFVEQSWLHMMQEIGAELGLEELAGAIDAGEDGTYEVAEEEAREEILRLRYDPELSAILAGLFTRRNFDALARMLEREPHSSELYLAHVLGASGAAALIRLAAKSPNAKAAKHFRRAARANRTIFYHRNRKPRSAAEVYEFLTDKYRKIPVHAGDDASSTAAPPLWEPLLPGWRIGGDEIPYAMR